MTQRKVLTTDYWPVVRSHARKLTQRKAAIAFVTEDLIGFQKGDILVINGSLRAIRGGQTKAQLLLDLHDRGVSIFTCNNLHAKVLWLGNKAVVGSANMSDMANRPVGGWQEVGVITDDPVIVAGAASIIEQLTLPKKAHLNREALVALTKVKVQRTGGWGGVRGQKKVATVGDLTWLAAMYDIEESEEEKRRAKAVERELGFSAPWVRFGNGAQIAKRSRAGDTIVALHRPSAKSRTVTVYRSSPIVRKRRAKRYTYLYYRERQGRHQTLSLSAFQRLLRAVGYKPKVRRGTVRQLPTAIADILDKRWVGWRLGRK